jgi:hypothetical protein
MKSQDIRHARKKVRKIQNLNVYYRYVVAINKIQMFERTVFFRMHLYNFWYNIFSLVKYSKYHILTT